MRRMIPSQSRRRVASVRMYLLFFPERTHLGVLTGDDVSKPQQSAGRIVLSCLATPTDQFWNTIRTRKKILWRLRAKGFDRFVNTYGDA
mmetsp:Transcript_31680/g.72679  ORF Transcript_31680/g.72679 Transcript_31680/m.72679 type:complete len:89 (-) Transcript_31680:58-324(-)